MAKPSGIPKKKARKPGRPPSAKEELKSEDFELKLSEGDKELLLKAAAHQELKPRIWGRQTLLLAAREVLGLPAPPPSRKGK